MNDISLQPSPVLPHHKLLAYGVARQLLQAVLACRVRDAKLREHAVRSAKSACLNCAEGAGRVTRADLMIDHISASSASRAAHPASISSRSSIPRPMVCHPGSPLRFRCPPRPATASIAS